MNDAPHDPESDAEQEAGTDDFVRRLLADAHGAESTAVPEHVSTRLDDTLAELLAQRSTTEGAGGRDGAALTDLSDVRARRRRRVLVGLGAAAAFVVAAGVALPTWLGSDSVERSTATTSDQIGSAPLVLRATSAEKAVQDYVAGLDEPVETPTSDPLRRPMDGALSESEDSPKDSADRGTFAAAGAPLTCEQPGDGDLHPATYDGTPALLVLTAVEDDRVLARVVLCGDPDDPGSTGSDSQGSGSDDSQNRRASRVPVQFVVPQP